jgi:hypothetical protein
MIRYIIIFILAFSYSSVFGQEINLNERISSIAEELAADEDDPEAVSIFIDRLHELAENPVKINSASETEISRLFFLSDFQVKALADYIHTSGSLVTVYELAAIPGFDKETAIMMEPFLTLENIFVNTSDSARWRNSIISNFSTRNGTSENSYSGSPWRILTKYKLSSGGFSAGLTMEKDPGEKILTGSPPLPDFLSGNFSYSGTGLIRRVIIGDFSARFGQGTNINTGMRRGISLSSQGYMSANDEIRPYTSTDENRFLRGAAVQLSFKKIDLALFFSANNCDATLGSSTGSSNNITENFYSGGLHNTGSLLNKKDAVNIKAIGASVSYNMNNMKFGLSLTEDKFSLPVMPDTDNPVKLFDFKGTENKLISIDYNSLIKNILLYGEFSVNDSRKYALVQGISLRPSDRLAFNLLFRSYKTGYSSFYANGPGTATNTSNETGILGNFTFEAAKHLFISGGSDLQYYPWLKYRCSAPSTGMRHELRVRYLPTEKLTLEACYYYRLSMIDTPGSDGVPDQDEIITRSYKTTVHYSVNDKFKLGARADFKLAEPYKSRGMLIFQELSCNFRRIPVTLWVRYCVFNTRDWSSRIYTYENDLLYSYSIPALAGEGSRSYIMARLKISKFAELRIKYGTNSVIVSGNVLNSDEVKMQMRIWF